MSDDVLVFLFGSSRGELIVEIIQLFSNVLLNEGEPMVFSRDFS